MYDIGTLKVAWVEKNVEYLSSEMFKPNELNEAVAFGEQQGDYMLMQLIKQKDNYYRWRVLPYGRHKQYLNGMKITRKIENFFNPESSFAELDNESGFGELNGESNFINTKDPTDVQNVRIFDVFVLGPLMIYTATQKSLPFWLRMTLLFFGITTILYNADNYIKNKQ
jgi:hypothetical protein